MNSGAGEAIIEAERHEIIQVLQSSQRGSTKESTSGGRKSFGEKPTSLFICGAAFMPYSGGCFATPKSRTQTKQSPSGWLKLFRLMRVNIRQNRATEIGDIDDDQDEILIEAKISAKANQQQHKVIEINGSLDFEQILIAINSKRLVSSSTMRSQRLVPGRKLSV